MDSYIDYVSSQMIYYLKKMRFNNSYKFCYNINDDNG